MTTDYDPIAGQYQRAKAQSWRAHIEQYTLLRLLGEVSGKAVLDLACGEGFFTRALQRAGAGRVVGVDLSARMIQLAQEQEARQCQGIEYRVHDVKTLHLPETFDLVVAAYLLNYAASPEELLQMCQSVARHLRPGGRFLAVNSNPETNCERFLDGTAYGFRKSAPRDLVEGSPITWTFFLADGPLEITNYHLSVATHEWAFAAVDLRDVRWRHPQVAPRGVKEEGEEYWANFLAQPPIIFLEAVKSTEPS